MGKERRIQYLNQIKPFINLRAVCNDYNSKNDSSIDYNNLRAVLNGVSKTRLSEEKLESFINYLYQYLYVEIFRVYENDQLLSESVISDIAEKHLTNMKEDIIKEIRHELYSEWK